MAEEHSDPPRPRPFWSGTISFGLVSVPVNLFPATRRVRPSLRLLDEDGTPLSRRYYCPEHDRDVHPEHILRGYEVAKGEYVIVRDEELEALAPRKSRDIDLTRFVETSQVPPLFYERAYYLTPAGPSNKAYRLLADVMERSGRAGIATFVMRDKEYLVAILAEKGLLRAETMRFQDEIRTPKDVGLPKPVKATRKAVSAFEAAIEKHSAGNLRPSDLRDEYAHELEKLVERKQSKGRDVVEVATSAAEDEDEAAAPDDVMQMIKRSIAQSNPRRGRRASRDGQAAPALEDESKDELYARAQKLDIPGRSRMNKQALLRALRRQQ
ncbi:MAG: Ku protein [Planctomycetes bacterium]|nr:Ku protein [Planctomycetota bacterium]